MKGAIKTYTRHNFHSHTFCVWQQVTTEEWVVHKEAFKSKSGSKYFFIPEGVFRMSNHWGRVANCRWRLTSEGSYKNQAIVVGFARWADFFPNDETARQFFIKVYFETNEVNYFHKYSALYSSDYTLRNASETSKTIKLIKEILTETQWANYLNYSNIEQLRKEIVIELINTRQTFIEIKKKYL
jgi:hypothetical protein